MNEFDYEKVLEELRQSRQERAERQILRGRAAGWYEWCASLAGDHEDPRAAEALVRCR